jgi:hypothetical protein
MLRAIVRLIPAPPGADRSAELLTIDVSTGIVFLENLSLPGGRIL